jgi:hypothetical protein
MSDDPIYAALRKRQANITRHRISLAIVAVLILIAVIALMLR